MSSYLTHKSRSDRKKKESRASNPSIRQSPSLKINQTAAPTSNSRFETACTEGSLAHPNSTPVYSNLPSMNPYQNFEPQDQIIEQYTTQVISGMSSLGIDTSPHLQQVIETQHGTEYIHSTYVQRYERSGEPQSWACSSTSREALWGSEAAQKDERLHGDLVGMGAQFGDQIITTCVHDDLLGIGTQFDPQVSTALAYTW